MPFIHHVPVSGTSRGLLLAALLCSVTHAHAGRDAGQIDMLAKESRLACEASAVAADHDSSHPPAEVLVEGHGPRQGTAHWAELHLFCSAPSGTAAHAPAAGVSR